MVSAVCLDFVVPVWLQKNDGGGGGDVIPKSRLENIRS